MPIGPHEDENKENYNPELKRYSPSKLVNLKRYKVLKELVLKNKAVNTTENKGKIFQERTDENKEEEIADKKLEFKDESTKTYGL